MQESSRGADPTARTYIYTCLCNAGKPFEARSHLPDHVNITPKYSRNVSLVSIVLVQLMHTDAAEKAPPSCI